MSKSGRIILVLAMAAAVAACAKKEEVMAVEPVTVEPEFTGKYK
jgi:nitrous oxide reductase accessory protein NosL